ncbi:MAG: M48 family metalloprotease [Lentisphaeria bacterium]|nr:M48 family metalloprotease [Lentisphaeria bacterium]
MNNSNTPLIASEEVRKNFIKSFILVAVVAALVIAASWYLGDLLGDVKTGLLIGGVVVAVVLPLQILTAKWAILGMARGREADPDDLKERRVLQLAEGLSISAGLSRVPDVYIIPTSVPNAFASGISEKDAFIGVTRGLLDKMNDQQLEGVLAHEFGHIIHRDIMLNQLVVGLISALLVIAVIIERVGFIEMLSGGKRRRNDRDSGGGVVILVLILLVVLIRPLTMLIGALLQSAISRQREYAADAVAVRLCSYNEGLASALESLGKEDHYSNEEIESLGSKQLAAMYIYFPSVNELFSTHPPIADRVARLRNMY